MDTSPNKIKRRTKGNSKVGRPTKMTENRINKLERAWALGATDGEACIYAGITKASLYFYQEGRDDFVERKELLKKTQVLKARLRLSKDLNSKDKWVANSTAKYLVDKHDGKPKQQQVSENNININVTTKEYKAINIRKQTISPYTAITDNANRSEGGDQPKGEQ